MRYFKLYSILLLLLLNLIPNGAQGQLRNKIFDQTDSLIANDTQTVILCTELLNYYRNTEYFDLIESGQTLFGSMFQLHARYQPHANVMLKVGFQTRQDYGNTGFVAVQPVIGLSLFKNKWRYNLGVLQGTSNYGFIEPMYNIDRSITNRIENGMQAIYRSKTFYYNNFLVWNQVTYRTNNQQEKFTTGFVANRLIKKNKWLYISLPFQATLAHRGGQLNNNPEKIYSRLNTGLGLKLNILFNSQFKIRTENHWLHSEDFSPSITQPYKNGNASWHTLSFMYKGFELMFNYWAGREYQSPVGTVIYNNYNVNNVYEIRQYRHMLMSRLMYTQSIHKNLQVDLRIEPFYDQEYKQFQYSYSIYLKLNIDKTLGKI